MEQQWNCLGLICNNICKMNENILCLILTKYLHSNEAACAGDVQIWSLSATNIPRIVESTNANNLFADIDVKLISMRFILLRLFNHCLAKVLPFISLNNHSKQSIVSSSVGLSELPDDMFGHRSKLTNLLTLKLRGLICGQVRIIYLKKFYV